MLTIPPDNLAYVEEYILLDLQQRPIDALGLLAKYFTEFRHNGQYNLCRRLLMCVKGHPMPEYGIGIVKYSEGWLYDRIGQWQDAIIAYKNCLESFHRAGILALDAELWTNIGSIHQDQGHWIEAENSYETARSIAEEQGDHKALGGVLNNLAGLYEMKHETEIAQKYVLRAIEIFKDTGDDYNTAASLVGLGTNLLAQSHYQEALDKFIEALSIFQKIGDLHGTGMALASIARLYQVINKNVEAKLQYQEALSFFIRIDDHVQINKTMANLGLVLQEEGDWQQAREYFEQALEGYKDYGDQHGIVTCQVSIGHLFNQTGDGKRGLEFLSKAYSSSRAFGFEDQIERIRQLFPNETIQQVQSKLEA